MVAVNLQLPRSQPEAGPSKEDLPILPLRSVSQLKDYTNCPMAYKLARRDKVWRRPAAWLPQGTAFHSVAEEYERRRSGSLPMDLAEAKAMFAKEYSKDIAALADETPNLDWWFWSGPYNGQDDIERRFDVGMEQVEKFVAWRESAGQTIWAAPDGKPAIELSFNIELDKVRVRGYIDAVVVVGSSKDSSCLEGEHVADCECRDGELRVRDYKTGNQPGDDFQLAVYALAVAKTYGVEAPKTGDYYMAGKRGKKATLTHPFDLTDWTEERIAAEFAAVEEGIQAERFDPDPEPSKCNFCSVALSCPAER